VYPIFFRLPDWVPLLGGEPITSFGVMMLLAFLSAGMVLRAELERKELEGELAWDLLFMAVLGGILGAKLYFVLLNFPHLLQDPRSLLLSRAGLVWYGGLMGGLALVVWWVRRRRISLPTVADAAAPALALGYAVGRMGCFLVGDDWGRPTGSWVGIRFPMGSPPTRVGIIEREFGIQVDPELIARFGDVVPVHPTQLYEVGLSLLIFGVLWSQRARVQRAGWSFMLWLSLAGGERFLVEFFRAKDDRFFGTLTLAQIISILLVAGGLVGLARLRGETSPDLPLEGEG
jgi:phosphatidylglycerol:prolipoprotein diacylglycerol transferase